MCLIFTGICEGSFWGDEIAEDKCEAAIKETILEDRATIVDETSNRLHATWLSQELVFLSLPFQTFFLPSEPSLLSLNLSHFAFVQTHIEREREKDGKTINLVTPFTYM